jgi:hypothetical protein
MYFLHLVFKQSNPSMGWHDLLLRKRIPTRHVGRQIAASPHINAEPDPERGDDVNATATTPARQRKLIRIAPPVIPSTMACFLALSRGRSK